MSETKNVLGRIQHKHDVEANWKNATNFIPKSGELIIYDPDSTHSYARFKIGDGATKVNELTFAVLPSGKDGSANGKDGIVIGEGKATGAHSVAGGSTDKSMATSLLGSVAGALVSLKPANAQAVGSFSFGASTDSVAAGTMSIGVNSVAGCLGYYISAIDFTNRKITLSTTQKYKIGGSTTKPSNLTWAVNDVISIFYNTGYYECSKITAVDKTNGIITVDSLPITTFELNSNTLTASYNPHDISVYVPQKPTSGEVQLGFAAYARGYGNKALGVMSNAIGYNNTAVDTVAFVTGRENVGSFGSLVGGYQNKVLKETGFAAGRQHTVTKNNGAAVGQSNIVDGSAGFATGLETKVYGSAGHTEGYLTQAGADASQKSEFNITDNSCAHAEGRGTQALNFASHAEGANNTALGNASHVEGRDNKVSGRNSHVEGYGNISENDNQHVQGKWNAIGNYAHIVGGGTSDTDRKNIHTIDWDGNAWFKGDILVGESEERLATENYADMSIQSFADGAQFLELVHSYSPGQFYNSGEMFNDYSTNYTNANFSHVEGSQNNIYVGTASHAEGYQNYIYGGTGAHVEGYHNEVYTTGSHAEGYSTHAGPTDAERDEFGLWKADGTKSDKSCAHAEGNKTRAIGLASHAEGLGASAIANASHAEGRYTESHGEASHAEGYYTKTGNVIGQHVQGRWNDPNQLNGYAHIVGWGTESAPKNIHTIGTSGNAWFAGNIYVGGTSQATGKRMPMIHSGTTEPDDSIGQNGDIYILYE